METLDLLAELLADYKGTVLTVSHDRAFLDSVATSILAIEDNGSVFEAVGGYSDYEENRKIREKEKAKAAKIAEEKANSQKNAQAQGRFGAEIAENSANTAKKRKRSYNEEREYAALPAKIEGLEEKIAEIQTELSKPEVYTDAKRIVELQKELSDLNSELEKAYDRFGELDSLGG